MAGASDLPSDVLALTKPGAVLLTGLTNAQAVRKAEMVDKAAICFVRGKKPEEATMELAQQKGIPLLFTRFGMYESCGKLYGIGRLGYSTAPDWVRELGFGAGMGLQNIKGCSDDMSISSSPGKGTLLEFGISLDCGQD